MEEYFRKFPTIEYNGKVTIDLTKNVKIIDTILRKPTLFYPYEVIAGDRPDNLSYYVYDDPTVDWVFYLANGITDPYYDWYLDEEQFNSLIRKKYGSIEKALKTIVYYKTNWASDDRKITASFYENNLAPGLKKYFAPIFGVGSNVIAYERNRDDHTTNTNRVLKLDVNITNDNTFIKNELVNFFDGSNTSVGSATVMLTQNTELFIQHVSGFIEEGYTLVSDESNTTATITDVTLINENITPLEETFWEPITAYEFEREKNEKNKIVNLMQPEFVLPLAEELRTKLRDNNGSI